VGIQVIRLVICDDIHEECCNRECKRLPQFIVQDQRFPEWYDIKPGTMMAYVIGGSTICEGCIDELYGEVKLKLNRKLWAFQ
jgi:hypothetical protein